VSWSAAVDSSRSTGESGGIMAWGFGESEGGMRNGGVKSVTCFVMTGFQFGVAMRASKKSVLLEPFRDLQMFFSMRKSGDYHIGESAQVCSRVQNAGHIWRRHWRRM